MLRSFIVGAMALGMCAFVPSVRAADDNKLDSGDLKFIRDAAQGGMEEVALGRVAAEKGTSEDVKKFGQHMVDDHSKANDELMTLATNKGVDLSADKPKMEKKDQKAVDKLSKKEGADFDKDYVDLMVKDHEKDVDEFQKASVNLKDEDLKKWAAQTLPTLQAHLNMVKDLQAKMGK